MLATFFIEFCLAFYVVWRYKLNPLTRLVTLLLLCLGIFQLAEYMVCGQLGLPAGDWSRLGYVCITLLPALALHIVTLLARRKSAYLLGLAYGSTALFALFFILVPGAVAIDECRANYAVFNMTNSTVYLYAWHYYMWLGIGIVLAIQEARRLPKAAKALYGMVAFYLVFVVPTTIITVLDPYTAAGIPSIMCGFAILGAIVIVGYVLPAAHKAKLIPKQRTRRS